jgi:hypothetical protein
MWQVGTTALSARSHHPITASAVQMYIFFYGDCTICRSRGKKGFGINYIATVIILETNINVSKGITSSETSVFVSRIITLAIQLTYNPFFSLTCTNYAIPMQQTQTDTFDQQMQ